MIFGTNFKPLNDAQLKELWTPPAGNSSEAIWHQHYDSLTYVQNADTQLTFFANAQSDPTLSNQQIPGMLPSPEILQIYNICLDPLATIPVTITTAAGPPTNGGALTDLALLLFGAAYRPTWQLKISNKTYGPYSLTTLGGTGGPTGWGWGSSIGTSSGSWQFGKNDASGGWNYFGRIIVPPQMSFSVTLNWKAAVPMTENKLLRLSLFGVLNRRVS